MAPVELATRVRAALVMTVLVVPVTQVQVGLAMTDLEDRCMTVLEARPTLVRGELATMVREDLAIGPKTIAEAARRSAVAVTAKTGV